MLAAYVTVADPDHPLDALQIGERPEPDAAEDWVVVRVEACALNRHDLWSLAGVGLPPDRMPMILGTDAAGTVDGRPVIVSAVINSPGWTGDVTLDPKRSLLSELHQGTMAQFVAVPRANLIDRPAWLNTEQAACLPTAWLTAYRMLTNDSGLSAGDTVLIQGASGGVASAATALGAALGFRVWATGRTEAKRAAALSRGADAVFEPGARLPERVDAVIETVGEATWAHSLRCLRPGGTIVCAGATSGPNPPAELNRVFFQQLRVIGSTMGTIEEFHGLLALLERTGVRPTIDRVLDLPDAAEGFRAMAEGTLDGKIVIRP